MKIIGIDLGTTSSAVSVYEMGNTRIIPLKGSLTTPSVIWINQDRDFIVGKEAKQHLVTDPEHILISTKRDLGSDKVYNIYDEEFTPTEAATLILRYLKKEAEKELKEEVNDVVITVPAYFGHQERGEVKKAAIDAGLKPVEIIAEPISAAIKYGVASNSRQLICVIDLGGGTFDVSVIISDYDRRQEIHTITCAGFDGDHYLGGDDFDNAIIDWMITKGAAGFKNKLELKSLAENAKIDLCQLSETEISHPVYLPNSVVLTRDEYRGLINEFLVKINEIIKRTINETLVDREKISMDDISRYVLVGGSCKHVLVKESIMELIGREPWAAPNLDTYVAEGAALYHHTLMTPSSRIRVTLPMPKTLGINVREVPTGELVNAILLWKGTQLPTRAVSVFYLAEGQSQVKVNVLEGENRMADDNKILDTLNMNLKYSQHDRPIVVEFCIDTSGVLNFFANEIEFNSRIEDAISELQVAAEGDANTIAPEMWDAFYNRYSAYVNKEEIKFTVTQGTSKV